MQAATLLALLAVAVQLVATAALDPPRDWTRHAKWKLGVECRYAPQKAVAIEQALRSTVVGQHAAVEQIVAEVRAWEADLQAQRPRPLTLIFTGSTGVGKTLAAMRLAEALLEERHKLPTGQSRPLGLVYLYGQDFAGADRVPELTARLRDAVAQALYECIGHAVIVVDEAQKAQKEVLSRVLGPIMSGTQPLLSHPHQRATEPLDASRAVVILISDIGVQLMTEFLQDASAVELGAPAAGAAGSQAGRPASPGAALSRLRARLASRMRTQLSAEFEQGGFRIGSLANSIVPFLPFNSTGAAELVAASVARLARADDRIGRAADAVSISPAAATLLALQRYTPFLPSEACARDVKQQRAAQKAAFQQRTAAGGASAEGGAASSASVGSDGTLNSESAATGSEEQGAEAEFWAAHGGFGEVCAEPCVMPRSCAVEDGGRKVMEHDEGPVKRLRKLLADVLRSGNGKASKEALKAALAAKHGLTPTMLASWNRNNTSSMRRLMHDAGSAARSLATSVWGLFAAQPPAPSPAPEAAEPLHWPGDVTVHVDVACGGGVADGTCSLTGAGFSIERCVTLRWPSEQQRARAGKEIIPAAALSVRDRVCRTLRTGDLPALQ